MHHFSVLFVVSLYLLAFPHESIANHRIFEFTGEVFLVFDSPYGLGISDSSNVTGSFVYNTNSLEIPNQCSGNCAGYRQQITGGLTVTIDNVVVQADDYIVEVFNDSDRLETLHDIYVVRWSNDLNPPLSSLEVDGVMRSSGLTSISFAADPSLFSNPSLPSNISPQDFLLEDSVGVFSDTVPPVFPPIPPDVLFNINTLTAVNADFDSDLDVDGSDFLLWQRSFGTIVPAADANNNGSVDAFDLSAWQIQHGNSDTSQQKAISVPEPNCQVVLLGILAVVGLFYRKIGT